MAGPAARLKVTEDPEEALLGGTLASEESSRNRNAVHGKCGSFIRGHLKDPIRDGRGIL